MTDQNRDFSSMDPEALLRCGQVRTLFEKLRQLDPALLQQAASMAAGGNPEGARQLLTGHLEEQEDSHGGF